MRGCGNGDMWVDVDFPAPHNMYLRRGWKTFARAHSLSKGHVLQFKLMESGLLSVKVFGCSEACLGCCVESLTDEESSSRATMTRRRVTVITATTVTTLTPADPPAAPSSS